MPLAPGTRLGPYEITGPLGAGGMGEVYRARDARLSRDVAIKILPAAFADDAARMTRFQREAQVLAALNHPNIAAIYGLEATALVMELVEGQTLAERIAAGAIPVDEALAIAHQIADALEAAHEKGIVHRDLKPANVKITPEGKVKVLDFGLAKAYDGASTASDPVNSPTLTMEATQAGVILGTAGYMSPEQARGKPVDKRADIWSFGVVLYEMLTGRTTFEGETVSDTLASILKSDPDWNRLPAGTPSGVRRLLHRCLERDPKKRLRDIGDAWIEMDGPGETVAAPRQARQWIPWAIAALVAVVGAWGWLHAPTAAPRTVVTRSSLTSADLINSPVLSSDGTHLAYSEAPANGLPHISLRSMDQLEGKPISGTENAVLPAFSPDGQWIAFQSMNAPRKLQKIPVTGGTPTTLCETPDTVGAAWGVDDTIVFGSRQGLMLVPAAGGTPQALTSVDPKKGETGHYFPSFLPGGKTVIFTVAAGPLESYRIALLDLKTRAQRVVVNAAYWARCVPTGHLVYMRVNTLFAVPFDLKRQAVTGPETPVVEGMANNQYTFSDTSLLVFRRGSPSAPRESTLEWSDRKGLAQPLAEPPHSWGRFRLSPNGKLVAGSMRDAGGKVSDIWIYDLDRRALVRMTFEGSNTSPVWSPDGRWVTYGSQRDGKYGIYRVAADKSGQPELLLATEFEASPTSWTPDGKTLFYTLYLKTADEIWTLRMSGSGESQPQRFSQISVTGDDARVSPDGNWVAYSAYASGKDTVYVVPFTGSGGKHEISTHDGIDPAWSRSGRELFYKDYNQVMAVDVPAGPIFRPGNPQPLFKLTSGGAVFDVTPDANRFLVEHTQGRPSDNTFITVTNWFDDLLRRAPLKH